MTGSMRYKESNNWGYIVAASVLVQPPYEWPTATILRSLKPPWRRASVSLIVTRGKCVGRRELVASEGMKWRKKLDMSRALSCQSTE